MTHTVRRIRVTDPWCASIRTEVQEGVGDVQIIPCACPGFESAPDEPERG